MQHLVPQAGGVWPRPKQPTHWYQIKRRKKGRTRCQHESAHSAVTARMKGLTAYSKLCAGSVREVLPTQIHAPMSCTLGFADHAE